MDGIKQECVGGVGGGGVPPKGLTNPGLTCGTLGMGMGMGTLGASVSKPKTLGFLVSTQRHVCTQK